MNENLAKALVAFQKDAPKIALDGDNPHFKSKFPTLAGIMDTVRAPLAAQDLAIVQQPATLESGMPALKTSLMHSSGESISEVMPLAVDKPGPQALGSALTYARRYSVLAILGLVGDEDDDAQSAEKDAKARTKTGPAAPSAPVEAAERGASTFSQPTGGATEAQQRKIAQLLAQTGESETKFTAKPTAELSKSEASDLIGKLIRFVDNAKAAA